MSELTCAVCGHEIMHGEHKRPVVYGHIPTGTYFKEFPLPADIELTSAWAHLGCVDEKGKPLFVR